MSSRVRCLTCGTWVHEPEWSAHAQGCKAQPTRHDVAPSLPFGTRGPDYVEEQDGKRLTSQLHAIRDYMLSHRWKTLGEIEQTTGYPQSSVSAQLRHLRKARFGGYIVAKRVRDDSIAGLYEYRVERVGVFDELDVLRARRTA